MNVNGEVIIQPGAGDVSRTSLGWTPETRVEGVQTESKSNNDSKVSSDSEFIDISISDNSSIEKDEIALTISEIPIIKKSYISKFFSTVCGR